MSGVSLYEELVDVLSEKLNRDVTADNPLSLTACLSDLTQRTAQFIVDGGKPEDHQSLAEFAHTELDRWVRHEAAN